MRNDRYFSLGNVHLPYSPSSIFTILGLSFLLVVMAVASLNLGTTEIATDRLLSWLTSYGTNQDQDIAEVMALRAPRIGVAILGGTMLAASGYLLQVVSGNALADPGLLGISQGTSTTVIIGSLLFNIPMQWLAFSGLVGGLGTAAFVLFLAVRLGLTNGLILLGIATGVILSSFSEIIIVAGGIERFAHYITWSQGFLNAASVADFQHLSIWAILIVLPLFSLTRSMALLELGTDQAAGLGISPTQTRLTLTIFAASLIAPVVTIIGPISFIGLIAAHIARRITNNTPGELLSVSMLCGAILLLGADLAGRTLFTPLIIPAGLIISVLGVCTFLAVAAIARISKR